MGQQKEASGIQRLRNRVAQLLTKATADNSSNSSGSGGSNNHSGGGGGGGDGADVRQAAAMRNHRAADTGHVMPRLPARRGGSRSPCPQELAGVCEALAAEGRFRVLDRISRGAFGTVVRAKPRGGGPEVAIKCMRLGPNDDGRTIAREILHHEKLLHAHVVRFRECFAAGPFLCIAMELVPGGDLLELVNSTRGLPENEARYLFQQLILAVDYCHRMGVMNRDIKPENTLLLRVEGKPPMVKLCDFGYAKSLEDSAPTTRAGTMHYVAPEVLANYRRSVYDGMKADVWSCGVLLYVTLFCAFPFAVEAAGGGQAAEAQQMHEMLRRMARGEFSFPNYRSVSGECKDLIRHMLDPEHTKRFSVEDIKQHPWFLRNLLPGTLAYNDRVLTIPRVPPQSEEEVQRVIDQVLAGSQSSHISGEGFDALQSDDEDDMI